MPPPTPSTPSTSSTPSTPPSSTPNRQITRSSVPTPSRTSEPPESRPQPSPPTRARLRREVTPPDSDRASMPPPPKERTMVRRSMGMRNLKDKDKDKSDEEKKQQQPQPQRPMSLRNSVTRSGSFSTKKEEPPAVAPRRSFRARTTGSSTSVPVPPERKAPSVAASVITSRSAPPPAPARTRERTSVAAPSRRPVSMHADTSPPVSAGASAPRKVPSAAAPVRAAAATHHRRNNSTPSSAPAASIAPPRPGTSASMASNVSKSRRPPFSTLQQNFAAPAAPVVVLSRKSMPPPPLDQATIHQQAQLLQYSCLYANSHATYAQLTASATAKLKRRFDTLAREHSRSREQLARRQRLLDMAGLTAVIETPAAGIVMGKRRDTMRSPEEKIQAFSEAIKKLEALQQNEHRAIAGAFGEWIAGYSPPPSLQKGRGGGGGWIKKRGRWIDGLGEEWRRQCLFTSRRIEAAVRAIECVVAAVVMDEESGVVSVVGERWMEVAKGMLEESQGMMLVEGNVVQRERRALEQVVALARAESALEDDKAAAGEERAVWAC